MNGDEVGARDGNGQKAEMAELVEHLEEAVDGQQQASVGAYCAAVGFSLIIFGLVLF